MMTFVRYSLVSCSIVVCCIGCGVNAKPFAERRWGSDASRIQMMHDEMLKLNRESREQNKKMKELSTRAKVSAQF